MTRKLTLSAPIFLRNAFNGTWHIEWELVDKYGQGYLVSWLEEAHDTHRTECMAFKAGPGIDASFRVTSWNEVTLSHNPDAALALAEVVRQLEELCDVVVIEHDRGLGLRPGEVVSDAI